MTTSPAPRPDAPDFITLANLFAEAAGIADDVEHWEASARFTEGAKVLRDYLRTLPNNYRSVATPPAARGDEEREGMALTDAKFCELYRKHWPTASPDAGIIEYEAKMLAFARDVAALSPSGAQPVAWAVVRDDGNVEDGRIWRHRDKAEKFHAHASRSKDHRYEVIPLYASPSPLAAEGEREGDEHWTQRVVKRVKDALGNIHDNLIVYSQNNGTSISTGDIKELIAVVERQGPAVDESAPLSKWDEAAVMSTWLTLHSWKDGERDEAFAQGRLRWLARKVRALSAAPSGQREEDGDKAMATVEAKVRNLPLRHQSHFRSLKTGEEVRKDVLRIIDAARSPTTGKAE